MSNGITAGAKPTAAREQQQLYKAYLAAAKDARAKYIFSVVEVTNPDPMNVPSVQRKCSPRAAAAALFKQLAEAEELPDDVERADLRLAQEVAASSGGWDDALDKRGLTLKRRVQLLDAHAEHLMDGVDLWQASGTHVKYMSQQGFEMTLAPKQGVRLLFLQMNELKKRLTPEGFAYKQPRSRITNGGKLSKVSFNKPEEEAEESDDDAEAPARKRARTKGKQNDVPRGNNGDAPVRGYT
eukprot:CAMPEP_0174919876 /NCGR_PEP_ID=MMETSP1355-20121228/3915_1 /TAXON_ID=464990 /ORGANISM="Hemiselmis tepida, Strain CCMP443" /LENGTH=239 /DNA_ID=CAMNT_0016165133 /DNA_START=75 /DNA_END=792 /DNA_ORIENTATION=+